MQKATRLPFSYHLEIQTRWHPCPCSPGSSGRPEPIKYLVRQHLPILRLDCCESHQACEAGAALPPKRLCIVARCKDQRECVCPDRQRVLLCCALEDSSRVLHAVNNRSKGWIAVRLTLCHLQVKQRLFGADGHHLRSEGVMVLSPIHAKPILGPVPSLEIAD